MNQQQQMSCAFQGQYMSHPAMYVAPNFDYGMMLYYIFIGIGIIFIAFWMIAMLPSRYLEVMPNSSLFGFNRIDPIPIGFTIPVTPTVPVTPVTPITPIVSDNFTVSYDDFFRVRFNIYEQKCTHINDEIDFLEQQIDQNTTDRSKIQQQMEELTETDRMIVGFSKELLWNQHSRLSMRIAELKVLKDVRYRELVEKPMNGFTQNK